MGNDWENPPKQDRQPDHGADGCPLAALVLVSLLAGVGVITAEAITLVLRFVS